MLIGFPLGHSFSQRYFEAKFAALKLDGWRYYNTPIESIDMLPEAIKADDTLRGFNVTIPHKQAVIPFLDRIDDEAAAIGAVNCVKISRIAGYKGKTGDGIFLEGFNTDLYGFRHSLTQMIGAHRPDALVLGTGGASKAVCHALDSLGINHLSISRHKSDSTLTYNELTPQIIKSHLLIINTTPLGMYPATDAAPAIDYSALTSGHMLFDLVYNPGDTLFLRHGRRARALVTGGYEMLATQAEHGWEIFSNQTSHASLVAPLKTRE